MDNNYRWTWFCCSIQGLHGLQSYFRLLVFLIIIDLITHTASQTKPFVVQSLAQTHVLCLKFKSVKWPQNKTESIVWDISSCNIILSSHLLKKAFVNVTSCIPMKFQASLFMDIGNIKKMWHDCSWDSRPPNNSPN